MEFHLCMRLERCTKTQKERFLTGIAQIRRLPFRVVAVLVTLSMMWACAGAPPTRVLDVPPSAHPELAKLQSLRVTENENVKVFGDGRIEKRNGSWVLHVKGTPYEMGYQQGILLKDLIRSNMTDMQGFLTPYIEAVRKVMKTQPPELMEELQGIAAGACVDMTYLFAADLLQYRRGLAGCSNVIMFGNSTKDGRLFHIRAYDWKEGKVFQNWVVAFYKPQKGIPFTGIISPGSVVLRTGMNMQGISIGHGLVAGTKVGMGVSDFCLFRYIVQFANNIDEATEFVMKAPPREHEMHVIAIADGANKRGRIFEMIGPTGRIIREPARDYVLCTNHLIKNVAFPQDAESKERYTYWQTSIEDNYGKIEASMAIDLAKGYCRFRSGARATNLHTAIFDANAGKMFVAVGPPYPACKNAFRVFDLKEELY